ncbi:DUF1285 domain-containing protein [Sphingomonas sp. HDW15A]|uniref:DUF1285 domain-containing protein n=1 Tax=Sphingomonas sp. HDW15A TaxID=2714942 RepID=UPI001407AAF8|nr:DUF1285 domain-containing protein [Sphingomonas sp. HDW15A]QIK96313.1 DUF1285 domain-containing protein [Sphingomonas sp. HDW15A]
MPESRPPIHVAGRSLAELAKAIDGKSLPPVDRWNPTHCGKSEMRIASDGTWYHMGSPIGRPEMVRLFSTVLRREPDGSHVLVTPVEKLSIEVEVTAFRAIAMTSEGEGVRRRIAFELDSGDAVILGPDHPLIVVEAEHGPSPRIAVRHGLEALVVRPVYYELAALALAEAHDPPGVWSAGTFFALDS